MSRDVEQSVDQILAYRSGFFIDGSSKAAVYFIHGIGGNAAGLHPIAQYLHEENGVSAEGICLPGHGTIPEDLLTITHDQWVKKAENEYLRLKQCYEKVYIGGISLGSLVCLRIAEKYKPDGVMLLCPPLIYHNRWVKYAGVMAHFKNYYTWKSKPFQLDPVKAGLVCYSKIPYHAVGEMTKLQKEAVAGLSEITSPVLAMFGGQDQLVSPKASICLEKHLKAPLQEVLYRSAGHSLLFSNENDKVFAEISSFLPQCD